MEKAADRGSITRANRLIKSIQNLIYSVPVCSNFACRRGFRVSGCMDGCMMRIYVYVQCVVERCLWAGWYRETLDLAVFAIVLVPAFGEGLDLWLVGRLIHGTVAVQEVVFVVGIGASW